MDVEADTAETVGRQSGDQRIAVDHAATRHVDHERAGPHRGERLGADQASRGRVERAVDADRVA
ncbi:MAG TPA: hypothetical protein VFS15_03825, partial [Kofleriaceae bacterium]|nr:hypothetical protein [Kofleriaceae bacterium]